MANARHQPVQLLLTCLLTPNCIDNISVFPTAWVLWSKAGTDQLSAATYCSHTDSRTRTWKRSHEQQMGVGAACVRTWRSIDTSQDGESSRHQSQTQVAAHRSHDKWQDRNRGSQKSSVWVPVCVDGVCVIEHPQGSDVINRWHLDGFLHPSTFMVVKRIHLVWPKTALRSVVKVSLIWPLWEELTEVETPLGAHWPTSSWGLKVIWNDPPPKSNIPAADSAWWRPPNRQIRNRD